MILSEIMENVLKTKRPAVHFKCSQNTELKAFLEAVQKNNNIKQLSLANNEISSGPEYCMIARLILNSQSIIEIDLSDNMIDSVGAKIIANAVEKVRIIEGRVVKINFANNPCLEDKENNSLMLLFSDKLSNNYKVVSYYPAEEKETRAQNKSHLICKLTVS